MGISSTLHVYTHTHLHPLILYLLPLSFIPSTSLTTQHQEYTDEWGGTKGRQRGKEKIFLCGIYLHKKDTEQLKRRKINHQGLIHQICRFIHLSTSISLLQTTIKKKRKRREEKGKQTKIVNDFSSQSIGLEKGGNWDWGKKKKT